MYNLRFLILAGLSMLILSCKTDPKNQENVINIRIKKDPERLNPLIFPHPVSREVYQYIHLPLADFDPKTLQLSPILIKSIPVEMSIDTGKYVGGIAFDVELVDDAKWDNGDPITAEDYIFTLKAVNLPLTNAGKYRDLTQNISDIQPDVNNAKKFKVIFAKDYMLALETAITMEIYPRYFYDSLNILGKYNFSYFTEKNEDKINSDSTLVKFADQFNNNTYSREKMSGSGPYKFVSWTTDQNIVLEKKSNYWAKGSISPALQQGPDKMIFHILPDELTAITQLKAGAIDVINEISVDSYNELQNDVAINKNYSFYHPALMKQYFIVMNNQDSKLKDLK